MSKWPHFARLRGEWSPCNPCKSSKNGEAPERGNPRNRLSRLSQLWCALWVSHACVRDKTCSGDRGDFIAAHFQHTRAVLCCAGHPTGARNSSSSQGPARARAEACQLLCANGLTQWKSVGVLLNNTRRGKKILWVWSYLWLKHWEPSARLDLQAGTSVTDTLPRYFNGSKGGGW